MKPKFSILLPTYNRADIINIAIESVLNQTEKDFELLIAGDGCTDNTAEVVQQYLKDKRVKWFDLPKAPGFGYANRNKILKEAKGEYIAFIAHDDFLFPDHLEILGKILDENKDVDIVYSRPLWVDPEGIIVPSSFNIEDQNILDSFMNLANGIPASCIIHRKTCFDKVGYWNENLKNAADWDLWKRIIGSSTQRNYKFEPTSTTFHFKAIWRTKDNAYPENFKNFALFMQENKNLIPESLKIKISSGENEQQKFWDYSKKDGWFAKIRVESLKYLDVLVQEGVSRLINRVENLKKDLLEAHEEIESLKKAKSTKTGFFRK